MGNLKYTKKEAKEWAKENLTGDVATFPTIFKEDDLTVDYDAMRDNFDRSIKWGCEGFWVNGVVGEKDALTKEEKTKIAELAVEAGAKYKLPVVTCVDGGPVDAMERLKHAQAIGVDNVFLCTLPGEHWSEEGQYMWYKHAADSVDISITMFNIGPWYPIGPRNAARLAAECPNIVGLKPVWQGQAPALMRFMKEFNTEFLLFTPQEMGYDNVLSGIIPPHLAMCAGAARFMHNGYKDNLSTQCWETMKRGNLSESASIYYSETLAGRRNLYFQMVWNANLPYFPNSGNMHKIPMWKCWFELMGLHGGPCRLPWNRSATTEEKEEMKAGMIKYGVIAP